MDKNLAEIKVQDTYGFTGGLGSHDTEDHGPQTTEWEDALIKHKVISKRTAIKTVDQLNTEWREEEEIRAKEEEANKKYDDVIDKEDEMDERDLLELRKLRLQELQQAKKKNKFGTVREITKPEFVHEVSEASNDSWVVCCLYVNNRENLYMLQCLRNVAARHQDVKFVQIVGPQCIEDYPEKYCPTLLIYKDNNAVGHIKGTAQFGGKRMTADIVEYELAQMEMFQTDQEVEPWLKFAKLKNLNKKDYQDEAADAEEESDSLDI